MKSKLTRALDFVCALILCGLALAEFTLLYLWEKVAAPLRRCPA